MHQLTLMSGNSESHERTIARKLNLPRVEQPWVSFLGTIEWRNECLGVACCTRVTVLDLLVVCA